MKLGSLFKAAAASAVIAGSTYGGYELGPRVHAQLSDTPMPARSQTQRETAEDYDLRLILLTDHQQRIDNSTDQEEEAKALDESKKDFATDIVLDRQLSERDFAGFAARFNPLSHVDTIRLRSYNFDPRTVSRRDECLASTPTTSQRWGADRYAYAQRVETCMINSLQRTGDKDTLAAQLGALAGGLGSSGLVFGFAIGSSSRRRTPKAGK